MMSTPRPLPGVPAAWEQFLSPFPWWIFLTCTHRQPNISVERGRQKVRLMINMTNAVLYGNRWRKRGVGLIYCLASERSTLNLLHHHLLLAGPQVGELDCSDLVQLWWLIGGVGKAETIRDRNAVCRYVSKDAVHGVIDVGGPRQAFH